MAAIGMPSAAALERQRESLTVSGTSSDSSLIDHLTVQTLA